MLNALARSLLPLFDAAKGNEPSAFNCPPWTVNHWRSVFGLPPSASVPGEEDEVVDIDSAFATQAFAQLDDGFTFSDAVLDTIPYDERANIMDIQTRTRAASFMQQFWKKYKVDSGRGNPVSYTMGTLPSDRGKNEDPRWPGYTEYRKIVLAMLNRKGGVLAKVQEIMVKHGFTPADRWKDDRDVNRVSGCWSLWKALVTANLTESTSTPGRG